MEERCQVGAIETNDETNYIVKEKCIGCGLCVSTCPAEAIDFIRKDQSEIVKPPKDEAEWLSMRAKELGKDLSSFML
jgi:Fe-S-cluster-containing hydrogenase component 2